MSQTIISSLKKCEKLIITAQNKIEIMFKIHFLFSLTMFMKIIEEFDYFLLIDDETTMITLRNNKNYLQVQFK